MPQYFTDQMTIVIKIDEPSSDAHKRRAFVAVLREIADLVETDTPPILERGGGLNNDLGHARYSIEALNMPVPEEAPYEPPQRRDAPGDATGNAD